jgi:RNA polymerase sigma-70 factor (ECF subfamily)
MLRKFFHRKVSAFGLDTDYSIRGTIKRSTTNGSDLVGTGKANMVTDVRVVESLRAQDVTAFRSLVERLQHPITGYLHRLVGSREVALDLAQDTFLQVYKEIGNTSEDLLLDAWIYRIATNYGLRYLNRKRLRQIVGIDSLFTPEDTNSGLMVAGPEDQTETRVLVQQTLSQLKPKDAACLQLHYGDNFTYEEIGQVLQMSPEAVRKRVARSVEKFRVLYEAKPRTHSSLK